MIAGGVPSLPANVTVNPGAYNAAQQSIQGGTQSALGNLQSALQANSQAYGGLQNQAQQQYQQNLGATQQGLAQHGLGNTTVATTAAQAPLQTLNNSLLNINGQQQGAAAGIYGQMAGINQSGGNSLANAQIGMQNYLSNQGNQAQQIGNLVNAQNAQQVNGDMAATFAQGPAASGGGGAQYYNAATDPAKQALSQLQTTQSSPAGSDDSYYYGG